jgi:uncharacterized integral membrane protein (TIGR00698 family)
VIKIQENYKGILLTFSLGLLAYFVAPFTSAINSVVLGLFLGILVGNLIQMPASFSSGIQFSSSKLLELSVVFLAFSINYVHIKELGSKSFVLIIIMVLVLLLTSVFLSKKLKCPGTTGFLVGFGTTICGSSAIAALSPSITKNKEDVGVAMAVVNLFGVIGMILMPFILEWLHVSNIKSGILLGGTLHSVGNVAGAGYTMDKEVGEIALTVKLARVSLLSPALILYTILLNRGTNKNWKEYLKLPWYLWLFIAITISTSLIDYSKSFLDGMSFTGNIILTTAMVGIGLKVSMKLLYNSGKSGLIFGFIIFAIQILVVSLLMNLWI